MWNLRLFVKITLSIIPLNNTLWDYISRKLTVEDFVEFARWSMGNKVSCYADLHKFFLKYS